MTMSTLRNVVAASVMAGLLSAPGIVVAMPLAPIAPAHSDIVAVAGGCGPGWHRGPYGGCRRNFAQPALHACPRGYHIGPGGRCRGNGR